MDPFIIEKDFKLLKPDKYTFFVLDRIMRGSPEVLISDHERLIICFSERPFPVWIWTPDDASEEEMERAYQLAGENGLVTGEHHFNMKYNLAEHFIRRAARDGLKMKLLVNMFAYDCPEPVRPEAEADGEIYRCEMRDVEELVSFLEMFHNEIGIDQKDAAGYRADAEAFIKAAEKEGITGHPVHIKLDTGMCRLGFNPECDMEKLIARLKSQNAVIPRSVFSHFVGSDSDGFDAFSARQFALFDKASRQLQDAFDHKILRHMDNSAGIEHFPERQMDMCRLGLGLYGVNPRTNQIMNNVNTLKTTILQMRNVKAGETVGYSRKGVLEHDSVIAAIPIGYADGLNRHLGNRHCYCLVNGQKAEYVGNICMDVAMIDVTGIDCAEGDMVEIFGDHLPVTVLSDVLETIPYEVMTGISNRVKRVYFQD